MTKSISTLLNLQPEKEKHSENLESNLDFILSHFSEPLFPRKISTYNSKKTTFEAYSREKVLEAYVESKNVDSKINAYSYSLLEFSLNWTPNLIFIDIDLQDFKKQELLDKTLTKTLTNITKHLGREAIPTVLWSGGGYHIIMPIDCPVALEQLKEFQEFDKPSEQLLRFYKDYFSNGKADSRNYPSFKSCLLRIPGSINSKYNTPVKIIQKWNGIRPRITKDLLIAFRGWLIQKEIDKKIRLQKALHIKNNRNQNYPINNIKNYFWIEKLLQTGIEDCRKLTIDLILAPYLIHVMKFDYNKTYKTVREWLDKCNSVQKLDDSRNFNQRIKDAIKTSTDKQIPPMSITKIKSDNRYDELYRIFRNRGILMT